MGWKEPMEKQPDKLTQDNSAAIAAGMSYGQWKAMQPSVPIAPRKPEKGYTEHVCEHCGCTFVRYDKKPVRYCGEKCKNAQAYLREKERKNNREKLEIEGV